MQSIATMRERLHDYLNEIDEKKVQALYNLFALDEPEYESPLTSKEFVAEMDARVARYKGDRSTGLSFEETKRRVQEMLDKHHSL